MNEHMQQLEEVLTKLAAKLNEFKGQLAANDDFDGRDARLTFQAAQGGTYFIGAAFTNRSLPVVSLTV